ncbi:hypothetical protein EV183_002675 [Coemansia sp. RSA 2336]|nr:hypothetical protein EV183_002675 [Coemansia sp. RSA 2336]
MSNWHKLTLLRKLTLFSAIVLICAAFVSDATVLAYINSNSIRGSPIKGAAGWTMFVAVISLLLLPLLLTRSEKIQRWVNRTAIELIVLGVLTLFYFISGIVLATKTGDSSCMIKTLCRRVKAATAFCWLAFFVLVGAMLVVGLVARVQSRLGLPLFTAYSFDVEGQEITPAVPVGASHDMHAAALSLGGTYFNGSTNAASLQPEKPGYASAGYSQH